MYRSLRFFLFLCAVAAVRAGSAQDHLTVLGSSSLPDAPQAQATTGQAPAGAPPADETPDQRKARELREEAAREVATQKKQRIGGIVPDFNNVISGQGVALSPKQKLDISYHTIKDPYTIGLAVLLGGYSELTDDHKGYGHGPAGYFKRAGASYADNVNGILVGNALLPILFHQDPRYFRKGNGSVSSRVLYSALSTFICKSDSGKTQFNISNVLGNFISGGISNAYYPSDERGALLTIENATTVTFEGMFGAQLLEFAPDLEDYVHRKREAKRERERLRAAAAATPAAGAPKASPALEPRP